MDDADYLRRRIEAENAAAKSAKCEVSRAAHERMSRLLQEKLAGLAEPPVAHPLRRV